MAKVEDDRRDEVDKEIDKALERAFTEIGLEAVRSAAPKAPHDTGLLRNSITFAVEGHSVAQTSYKDDDGKQKGKYSNARVLVEREENKGVSIGTNVEYAPYQEFGTSSMKASPFLRPAIEGNINKFKQILKDELDNVE